MKYKLVLFDLDGTLLDTLDDLTSSVNYALKKFHLPLRTKEEIRSFIGNGSKVLIHKAVGENISNEIEDAVFKTYFDHYNQNFSVLTKPYPGILELLKFLKAQGVKLGIVTNKPEKMTLSLAKVNFNGLMDVIYAQSNKYPLKPDKTILEAAIKEIGVLKEETFYVGDSMVDVNTARNAGVDFAIFTYGYENLSKLQENHVKLLLNNVEELKQCLM